MRSRLRWRRRLTPVGDPNVADGDVERFDAYNLGRWPAASWRTAWDGEGSRESAGGAAADESSSFTTVVSEQRAPRIGDVGASHVNHHVGLHGHSALNDADSPVALQGGAFHHGETAHPG
jgi:hypothetical protein